MLIETEAFTNQSQATPAWLTTALRSSGALISGTVTDVAVETGRGNWSANARLTVQYSAAARGDCPTQLFLKLVNTDQGDESFGPSEVDYYTRDYVGVPDVPLVRCHAAAYSAEQQRYHLLLDDVSATHVQATQKTPTLEYGLALAEGLAAMHAHWWGTERLAQTGAPPHSPEHLRRFVTISEPGVGHLLAHYGAELPTHWPGRLHQLFEALPAQLIARAQDASTQTLIHGDAGAVNLMVSREGDRPIYILDRQPFDWSLTTWVGPYDLAYTLIQNWESDLRRLAQQPILRHYLAGLQARGITNYTWEQVWADYRLSAALVVAVVVEYCRGGVIDSHAHFWPTLFRRAMTAWDDLGP